MVYPINIMNHILNLETVYTYKGTQDIYLLIITKPIKSILSLYNFIL